MPETNLRQPHPPLAWAAITGSGDQHERNRLVELKPSPWFARRWLNRTEAVKPQNLPLRRISCNWAASALNQGDRKFRSAARALRPGSYAVPYIRGAMQAPPARPAPRPCACSRLLARAPPPRQTLQQQCCTSSCRPSTASTGGQRSAANRSVGRRPAPPWALQRWRQPRCPWAHGEESSLAPGRLPSKPRQTPAPCRPRQPRLIALLRTRTQDCCGCGWAASTPTSANCWKDGVFGGSVRGASSAKPWPEARVAPESRFEERWWPSCALELRRTLASCSAPQEEAGRALPVECVPGIWAAQGPADRQ